MYFNAFYSNENWFSYFFQGINLFILKEYFLNIKLEREFDSSIQSYEK